jgi:hypothetical protein
MGDNETRLYHTYMAHLVALFTFTAYVGYHLPPITAVAYTDACLTNEPYAAMNNRFILIQYVCSDRFALLYHPSANPSCGSLVGPRLSHQKPIASCLDLDFTVMTNLW